MTLAELVEELEALQVAAEPESGHITADRLLLEYIDDKAVTEAFKRLQKWYS